MRTSARRGPLSAACCLFFVALSLWPTATSAAKGRWLLDHLAVDTSAAVGWRSGWLDAQHDGFWAAFAGAEANLGLEFGGGYAVLAGGRVLYGTSSGLDAGVPSLPYLEASGQLGAQLRIADWVRLGVGGSAGRIWRGDLQNEDGPGAGLAIFAGGFLRCGVDFLPRQNATLLRALSLWVRLDITGHPRDDSATLPRATLSLALGLGLRL